MQLRTQLYLGGIAGMLGAVILSIVPLFLPRPTTNEMPAVLMAIADSSLFRVVHFSLLIGALAILATAGSVYRYVRPERPATTWAQVAIVVYALLTTLIIIQNSVQGIALKDAALHFVGSDEAGKAFALATARAIIGVNTSLLAAAITVSGLAAIFLGLALATSRKFDPGLGWVGVSIGVALLVGRALPQTLTGGTGTVSLIAAFFHWVTMVWLFVVAFMIWLTARSISK